MIPKVLRLKGLNSFIQEQTVDFQKLTAQGIFGIFGPTGSGKSTILDGITLALYNKLPRNTNEFINKETNETAVSFEFLIDDGCRMRCYVAERSYKRTETMEAKQTKAVFYEKMETGQIEVLAEKSGEVTNAVIRVIGLNYEDFSRSVVLPQGKFSEFLSLTGKDRRNMLERIFHLEQYGQSFSARVKKRADLEAGKLREIEAKLSVYQGIDEKTYLEKMERKQQLEADGKRISQEIAKKKEALDQMKALYGLVLEWEEYQNKNRKLQEEKTSQEQISRLLEAGARADKVLPFIQSLQEIEKELMINQTQEGSLEKAFEEREKSYQLAKETSQKREEEKKEKLPALTEEKNHLRQAKSLLEEAGEIKKQRDELAKQYRKLLDDASRSQTAFRQVAEQWNKLSNKQEEIQSQLKQWTVDPKDRRVISEGYRIERSLEEQRKKQEDLRNKTEKTQEHLTQIGNRLETLCQEENQLSALEADQKNQWLQWSEELPTQREEYYSQSKALAQLETVVKEKEDLAGQIEDLEKRLSSLDEKYRRGKEQYEKKNRQWEEKNKTWESLCLQIESVKNSNMAAALAALLKENEPCPVCGSRSHPSPARQAVEALTQSMQEQKTQIEAELKELDNWLQQARVALGALETQRDLGRREKQEKTQALGQPLAEIQEQYRQEAKGLEEKKTALDQKEQDAKELQEKWEETKRCLTVLQKEQTALEEKRAAQAQYLSEKKKELDEVEGEIKEDSLRLSAYRQEYPAEGSFAAHWTRIQEMDEKKQSLEQLEEQLKKALQQSSLEKDELAEQVSKLEGEKKAVEAAGKEKKQFYEEKMQQVQTLSHDREVETALRQTEEEIDRLERQEEEAKADYQQKETLWRKAVMDLENHRKQKETLEGMLTVRKQTLDKGLAETGFSDRKAALDAIISKEERQRMEQAYGEYQAALTDVSNNLRRLEEKIGGRQIEKEKLEAQEAEYQQAAEAREALLNQKAVLEKEIETMKDQLGQVKQLNQQRKEQEHRCGLYQELASVMSGNRFVEFIASSELSYITLEASKRLKAITNGRYALELMEGEFVMRDDFSGGVRRKPSTLSGGETFLTSFCLALALSSKIQMKNGASLRFFFLDEGFGTLDSELLDVVITSLEKLRDEKLNVGIISHVEELKNRLPVRLLVIPANQGVAGTKVKIEYD